MTAHRAVHAALQRPPRRGAQSVFQSPVEDRPHGLALAQLARAAGLIGAWSTSAMRISAKKGHLERLFQGVQVPDIQKVFRRVAARYDKLNVTFLGFVHLAGTMKWLY